MSSGIVRATFPLFRPFAERVERAIAAARKAGHDVYIFESARTPSRQTTLYAQGRTAPGRVVTRAKAWESLHQYGLAIDTAFAGPGKWHWAGDFEAVAKFMRAEGLEGLSWEKPHWQWPVRLTTDRMRQIVASEGLLSLWCEIARASKIPTE